uniref:Uncharacterized protein n=1 Tax=Bactrocera latifrons TaxID=174628 RepID=A0A0K8VA67_BACLA
MKHNTPTTPLPLLQQLLRKRDSLHFGHIPKYVFKYLQHIACNITKVAYASAAAVCSSAASAWCIWLLANRQPDEELAEETHTYHVLETTAGYYFSRCSYATQWSACGRLRRRVSAIEIPLSAQDWQLLFSVSVLRHTTFATF